MSCTEKKITIEEITALVEYAKDSMPGQLSIDYEKAIIIMSPRYNRMEFEAFIVAAILNSSIDVKSTESDIQKRLPDFLKSYDEVAELLPLSSIIDDQRNIIIIMSMSRVVLGQKELRPSHLLTFKELGQLINELDQFQQPVNTC